MKNRLKAKIAREYWRRQRIYWMYILCKAYEMYHMMQLHAACAKSNLSYEEAEQFSDMMNNIFRANTTAESFITDNDVESNAAIEYYEQFQHIVMGLEDLERDSIVAFCKRVYFGNGCIGLKIDGYMFYPLYLEALIKHVSGFGTLNDVRDAIIDFKPWYDKPRKTDSRKFRRDFQKIERIYAEIYEKKEERLKKFLNKSRV